MLLGATTAQDHAQIDPDVLTRVRLQLLALAPHSAMGELTEAALLMDDLGLDSLKLVDLTVRLESALEIAEFPMQEWVDGQLESGRPLSVGELARACQALRS
jgi:acyl carrier protein